MTIERFFVRDVTIIHPATTDDRRGTPTHDWDNATRTDLKGWLALRGTSEIRDHREAQLSTWVLELPADTTVEAIDRVEVDGSPYEINGEINRPWTPNGEHHVVVPLDVAVG